VSKQANKVSRQLLCGISWGPLQLSISPKGSVLTAEETGV